MSEQTDVTPEPAPVVPRWFEGVSDEVETAVERGLQVLCIASETWARGDSIQDAHEKLDKPKQCIFYLCGPHTHVDGFGGLNWRIVEGTPIEIGRFGFKSLKTPKKK